MASPHWDDYLNKTKGKAPSALLRQALASMPLQGRALDLGAGAMRDARYLLERGFEVDAVDSNPEVAKYAPTGAHLTISTFDTFPYPGEAYDLVNAQYALPFNPPETFEAMFAKLRASLKPGGVFVGQFFGPEDSWSGNPRMTFHAKEEAERLLAPFVILLFEEEKREGKTTLGEAKLWHVFHVTARRRLY